jgi:uncharacterized protein (DUF2249 family)
MTEPAAIDNAAFPGTRTAAVADAPAWTSAAPLGADLDVRPLLARSEEPFGAIMAAAKQVAPGQVLRLRATFEPFPLYHVLGKQGFAHAARQLAPGDWEVLFYRTPAEETAGGSASDSATSPTSRLGGAAAPAAAAGMGVRGNDAGAAGEKWPAPSRTVTIDVSDLVPPEPMVRILEALEQLNPGEALLVNHVRRPVYLYARLDELGYRHETRELGPNQIVLRILKPADWAAAEPGER